MAEWLTVHPGDANRFKAGDEEQDDYISPVKVHQVEKVLSPLKNWQKNSDNKKKGVLDFLVIKYLMTFLFYDPIFQIAVFFLCPP